MSLTDVIKHALPIKLKDGKRHVFPTITSLIFKRDGTPLENEDGLIEMDVVNAAKLGGVDADQYALKTDATAPEIITLTQTEFEELTQEDIAGHYENGIRTILVEDITSGAEPVYLRIDENMNLTDAQKLIARGNIDAVATVNGISPDEDGNVDLGDIGGGDVQTVNGVQPDKAGNIELTAADVGARPDDWMPTAAEVGALAADGTAVNAEQLGGVAAAEYALKSEAGGMSMVLLWENGAPNSSMSAYTATLSQVDADKLLVVYVADPQYARLFLSVVIVHKNEDYTSLYVTQDMGARYTRPTRWETDDTVVFSNGLVGTETNARVMVPYQIYGIYL